MESVILKILWYIVHFIADFIETFYYIGLEFRENFYDFIKNISKDKPADIKGSELQLIERSIQDLEKIPKHIVVLLNINHERDVDLSKLTNLIFWALNSGVHFISFYDYKGIIKHQLASSFHHLIREKLNISDSDNVVWGPDYQSQEDIRFPYRNGFRRHIVINLYSSEDGYGIFNKLLHDETSKKIADEDVLNSKDITIEQLDKKLSKYYGNIPDPELAIYFGRVTCTAGLLPWQIRLTEFIQISYKLNQMSLDKYLRVLYKYAKCEQRYGK